MSEVGMFDGRPIVLQRRFDAPIYAVWQVVFHDFWTQVALATLMQGACGLWWDSKLEAAWHDFWCQVALVALLQAVAEVRSVAGRGWVTTSLREVLKAAWRLDGKYKA